MRACPFCGSLSMQIHHYDDPEKYFSSVQCLVCKSLGPPTAMVPGPTPSNKRRAKAAEAMWDRRVGENGA
jgi:hypothetical protein